MLHMQRGDVIDVALSGNEYLLYIRLTAEQCNGRHEAAVYPTKSGKNVSNNYRAYSSRLCKAIFSEVASETAVTEEEKQLRFPAGQPMIFGPNGTAVPIITRNPL